MKKIRIDVITKYFYPVAAGIETNILETYGILASNGFEVIIHTSKDIYSKKNILSNYEELKGMKIKRYKFGRLGFWPKIDWNDTNFVCLHNFDLFPHFQILILTLIKKLFRLKKFKLVLTPHGGYTPEWSIFTKSQMYIKKIYTYTLGTVLINFAIDGFRAVSEWEKKEIIKHGVNPKKITVITNGLENEAFLDIEKMASREIKEKVDSLEPYIIQIGRIYPIKNYETTIKALLKIPKNINYVIVGPIQKDKKNSAYKNELDALIKDHGLSKRVHFLGVIRGVNKYYLIRHAKMMVHMAKWESFCNVVHEGLSQGLICIVANNSALPLLIKNNINGFVVDTFNSNKLSEKINYVLNNFDTNKLIEMRSRNKKFVKKDSWKSVALKVKFFYLGL